MYCPNCGTTISTELKFCRSCGLGLEKIAQSLVEQIPTKVEESLQERKERIERWGVAALSVFGLGLLGVALYHIVKMMIEGRILAGLGYIGLMIVLGCGLLSVILFAKAEELEKTKTKGRITPPEELANKLRLLNCCLPSHWDLHPALLTRQPSCCTPRRKVTIKKADGILNLVPLSGTTDSTGTSVLGVWIICVIVS